MIVLDTNVLSEVIRPRPSEAVLTWLGQQTPARLFVTTITEAEMRYGLALLADGRRREALGAALTLVFDEDFRGRVLPFDRAAAGAFARIAADRREAGRPIAPFDAQIAAIARSRGAAVATRDAGGFDGCGVDLIDPWA